MSGYDIKQFLGQLSWLVGSPSCGSLYPALPGLLSDGLVSVDTNQTTGKPARKVYSLTAAGSSALKHWLGLPATRFTLKDFAKRLLLANHLAPEQIVEFLRKRRSDVTHHQERMEHTVRSDSGPKSAGNHLALDHALALARAELYWLDGALSALAPEKAEVCQETLA
jgi:DNA-binding PadR family transcriptional regulator